MLYKVYLKNYLKGTASFVGVLPERRKHMSPHGDGINFAAAFRWARLIFGGLVKDARALFIVPSDNGKKDKGASSVEYALLVCFVAAVIILVLSFTGQSLKALLEIAANLIPLP